MISYRGGQRRKYGREVLPTPYPVTFEYKERSYHALLTNISLTGAGMRSVEKSIDPHLIIGLTISFQVTVTFGTSKVLGRIAWVGKIDGIPSWGVEFTKLSDDDKDPLRRLLDAIAY